jgi:phosphocarrier protein
MSETLERDFIIPNKLGIHARVAAQIVKVASEFESEVWLIKDGIWANGKSILDIMTLICPQGTRIRLLVEGQDANDALSALAALFQNKFGET